MKNLFKKKPELKLVNYGGCIGWCIVVIKG